MHKHSHTFQAPRKYMKVYNENKYTKWLHLFLNTTSTILLISTCMTNTCPPPGL